MSSCLRAASSCWVLWCSPTAMGCIPLPAVLLPLHSPSLPKPLAEAHPIFLFISDESNDHVCTARPSPACSQPHPAGPSCPSRGCHVSPPAIGTHWDPLGSGFPPPCVSPARWLCSAPVAVQSFCVERDLKQRSKEVIEKPNSIKNPFSAGEWVPSRAGHGELSWCAGSVNLIARGGWDGGWGQGIDPKLGPSPTPPAPTLGSGHLHAWGELSTRSPSPALGSPELCSGEEELDATL